MIFNPSNASFSIYIHIPFCKKKCAYCSFYKVLWQQEKENLFLDALSKEFDAYRQRFFGKLSAKTVFIGGGTPSCLSFEGLQRLLKMVRQNLDYSHVEFTVELNPESVDGDKLRLMKDFGVNRISLGVQSFHEEELRSLGRIHTVAQVESAIRMIQSAGFLNINFDIIFGLPAATIQSLEYTLRSLLAFSPTHISAYALTIEKGTPFSHYFKNSAQDIFGDFQLKLYQFIRQYLKKNRFKPYEVSAFSKKGFQCRHNLRYWQFEDYIGLGPGAHSFLCQRRYFHKNDLDAYCRNPIPTIFQKNIRPLSKKRLIEEFMIMHLRLLKGINVMNFQKRFQVDLIKYYQEAITKLTKLKLIKVKKNNLSLTTKGLYLLNEVLLYF